MTPHAAELIARFRATRAHTDALAAPLSDEDQLLQSMPAASPTKWHRAHTTWFFETFVLGALGRAPRDPRTSYLWNSPAARLRRASLLWPRSGSLRSP